MSCFFCGSEYDIHYHHIFGAANRKKSTKYGLVVPLCRICHMVGRDSIHEGWTEEARKRRLILHQYGQARAMAENDWSTEDFIREFGRNYL